MTSGFETRVVPVDGSTTSVDTGIDISDAAVAGICRVVLDIVVAAAGVVMTSGICIVAIALADTLDLADGSTIGIGRDG